MKKNFQLTLNMSKTASKISIMCVSLPLSLPPSDQAEARRNKAKLSRQRREERQKAKQEELKRQYAKEDQPK